MIFLLFSDSIYTERYMDTPAANPIGYQRSDLTAAAEKLRGRRFLLIHGTGDDNVHYQHSMQLAKQLQHADIAFEQMVSSISTSSSTCHQEMALPVEAIVSRRTTWRRSLLIEFESD